MQLDQIRQPNQQTSITHPSRPRLALVTPVPVTHDQHETPTSLRHLIKRGMILSAIMLLSAPTVYAKEKTLSTALSSLDLKTTQAATVVIVPPDQAFRVRLNEKSLKEVGETYTTQDPTRIASLIQVLQHAQLKTATDSARRFEPREGVFLTLADGSHVDLLFEKTFDYRSLLQGTLDGKAITSTSTLPHSLIQWTLEKGAPFEAKADLAFNATSK